MSFGAACLAARLSGAMSVMCIAFSVGGFYRSSFAVRSRRHSVDLVSA
jgi:hypothetical protein